MSRQVVGTCADEADCPGRPAVRPHRWNEPGLSMADPGYVRFERTEVVADAHGRPIVVGLVECRACLQLGVAAALLPDALETQARNLSTWIDEVAENDRARYVLRVRRLEAIARRMRHQQGSYHGQRAA